MPSWLPKAIGYGGVAVVVALIPQFVHGFRIVEFTYVGVYTAVLVGLVILTGITGQISLGQGGFMAFGAYTTAILSVDHGWPQLRPFRWAGSSPASPASCSASRRCGSRASTSRSRRSRSRSSSRRSPSLSAASPAAPAASSLALPKSPVGALNTDEWLYYVTWGGVAILYVLAFLFIAGKRGRALRAIRENELAATASGVSLSRYKTMAFGVAAFYAGISGSLLAILQFGVTPGSFPLDALHPLAGRAGRRRGRDRCSARSSAPLFVQYIPSYSGDVLGPVVNFAQKIGLPVDDVDKTTPGRAVRRLRCDPASGAVPAPERSRRTRPEDCIPNEARPIVV